MRGALATLVLVLLAACGQEAAGPDMGVILADSPAPTLAAYGFFKDAGAREPADGVVAYDLVNPLFSDHAAKHRFVYVPDGEAADYEPDAVFDFPVGTVLIKTFAFAPDMREPSVNERYRETRLLIHKQEGWAAYPYVWNEGETEASYAPAGAWLELAFTGPGGEPVETEYRVPNQNQCKTCHQLGEAIAPIGPKARNLNHVGPYGRAQLADWSARGLLQGLPDAPPSVPDVHDATASLEGRARAYLDVNCAHCHRLEGSASNSGLLLGWSVEDPVALGIGKHPTAAGRGSGDAIHVIAPGAPDHSILTYRMASTEAGIAMPELGRSLADAEGVALVRAWIAEMPQQ
ncbi:SO2930 family diheme c-type cytochrome [Henriciella aquimarina]|uniref:SO2930 family diheme c-type cytochrome n=1 Tax=Henriciella aquimarina TaxID=545261 RepID=UPI000A018603|nr:SO2930 family diheme c-type cytochrome [Henriciella aquimarina]